MFFFELNFDFKYSEKTLNIYQQIKNPIIVVIPIFFLKDTIELEKIDW